MAGLGHEERFPPTRLSVGCGFRKETIAGMHRNGRDAPIAAIAPGLVDAGPLQAAWSPAALERELVQIGVAEKQKHTARLVLERSAQYAGFFEHGKDRLVMPGVAPGGDERREAPKPDEPERRPSSGAGGGGDNIPPRHPLIEGMFQSLPENGQPWSLEEAADWLHAAAYNLRFAYKLKGKITIDIKIEQLGEPQR
jgi:hypothetical protein